MAKRQSGGHYKQGTEAKARITELCFYIALWRLLIQNSTASRRALMHFQVICVPLWLIPLILLYPPCD